MLTLYLYRTPIVLGSNPGARVCFVEVENLPEDTPEGHLFIDGYPKRGTWPAIENADDPDMMPADKPGETGRELIMTRMDSSKRPALWLPGTKLFVHGLATQAQLESGIFKKRGLPSYVRGCAMPGWTLDNLGGIGDPDHAMIDIFEALGGWEEGKRVPFRCVELGELPATRYQR